MMAKENGNAETTTLLMKYRERVSTHKSEYRERLAIVIEDLLSDVGIDVSDCQVEVEALVDAHIHV